MACFLVVMVVLVVDLSDYIFYKRSIETKEDVFQMIYENQGSFEQLANQVEGIYKESGEKVIILRGKS